MSLLNACYAPVEFTLSVVRKPSRKLSTYSKTCPKNSLTFKPALLLKERNTIINWHVYLNIVCVLSKVTFFPIGLNHTAGMCKFL